MPEISGRPNDILFNLEQIKLLTQEKDSLTDSEKNRIKRIPVKRRAGEKEALLKEKETKRKAVIRIWILDLEEKVRNSDLPIDIKNQILDMTTDAKEKNMIFQYNLEEKIEQIHKQIKEAEAKEEQKKMEEMTKAAEKVIVAPVVLATVAEIGIEAYKKAHPDWYHVQYTPEKLKQMRIEHFENTVVREMAEMQLPYAAEKTYTQKQGSQYTKAQQALANEEEKEVVDFSYQKAKQTAEKMGKKAPDETEFKTKYWPNVPAVKKRAAQKTFAAQNPEKAKDIEQKKLMADKLAIEKNIERQLRKRAKKEVKRQNKEDRSMKGMSKRLAAAQKQTNHQILKKSSQTTKTDGRVSEKSQVMSGKPAQRERTIKVDSKQITTFKKMQEKKSFLNAG